MLCENCKKNIADTYFRKTVNGKTSEIFLCSECAKELGVTTSDVLSGGFGLDAMLPKLFRGSGELKEIVCPGCGIRFSEISKTGKVGCDKCYSTFAARLDPAIARIHGNKRHIGKTPSGFKKKSEGKSDLRAELERAIAEERFEDAARIRDEIRNAEGKGEGK